MAGLRDLLASQPRNEIARVSAFTIQLQEHLPPVEAANVVIRTKSDITGSFQISVGTTLREDSWISASEKGSVRVEGSFNESKVTVSCDGRDFTQTIKNERTGVPPEVHT